MLIFGNDFPSIHSQQLSCKSGAGIFESLFEKLQIYFIRLLYKFNFFQGNRVYIVHELCQSISMDGMNFCSAGSFCYLVRFCNAASFFCLVRFCNAGLRPIYRLIFLFSLQHCLPIDYNLRDIGMCVTNRKKNLAFCCFQSCFHKNTAGNSAKCHGDFPLINKPLRTDIVGRRNICQRLQALIRIPGNISKGSGKNISHFFGIGNTAGEGIFIHAAIHSDI